MAKLGSHTFLESSNRAASVNSDGFRLDGWTRCTLYVDVTASSGTSPTLDIFPQFSTDNTNFFRVNVAPDITEDLQVQQTANTATVSLTFDICCRYMRVEAVQAGTADRFTYDVKADFLKES